MKQARINALLGITYPIIQGGMLWIATARLAAAVSNAGGLGVVSPLAGMQKEGDPANNFREQLLATREQTNRPFGINIPLDLNYADILMDIALSEKVKIIITSAGNPNRFTKILKKEGVKVLHVVSSVRQAVKAESCGSDGVIAEGIEAAAHNGADELPLFALVPQVAENVAIPIIAAGGIVDARGIAAALALGADGVQLGTRFVAVKENIAHMAYKRAIIDAQDTGTVITCRRLMPTRSLKTKFTNTLTALEKAGATKRDLLDFIGYRSNRDAQIEGNLNCGEAYCGASAGLIREILSVQEVVSRLVREYEMLAKQLPKSLKAI